QAFLVSLDGSVTRMSTSSELDLESSARAAKALSSKGMSGPGDQKDRPEAFTWMRYGDGNGRIESCEIVDRGGNPIDFAFMDEIYRVRFHLVFDVACPLPVFGIYVKDRLGTDVFGINTYEEGTPIPAAQAGDRMSVEFE